MIYYPKIYGTCKGSNTAIELAFDLKDKNPNKNVYIYKEILHNPYIIDLLKKRNIICIDDLNIVTKKDILIIRAHGEPKSTYEYLDKKKIEYYDATCVNVKRIHKLVEEKYNQNKEIIIIGKKEHPEVIGTNGWCNNSALIIENEDDYKKIKIDKEYFVICQTTINENKLNNLINYLNDNNIKYEYINTICSASHSIQNSSVELAKDLDVIFVIGGKSSSNTKELFDKVSACTKSYYFSNLIDFYNHLKESNYTNEDKIGFTGGASTPKEQIYEYAHLLEFYIYLRIRENN